MKNRGKLNVILDMIMFVVMLAVFCIKGQYHESLAYTIGGLVLLHIVWHWRQYWTMLKKNMFNRNLILDMILFLVMLSLFFVKHNLHETMAYTLGILAIVHFIWHWKHFKALYCQLIPKAAYRCLVGIITAVFLSAVLTAPLYLTINERGGHGGPPNQFHGQKGHN